MNVWWIATANDGDLDGREAVHDSATKVSSKLADTQAVVTASTLSESMCIPNISRAAKMTVNTRIKPILTRSVEPTGASKLATPAGHLILLSPHR